MDVFTASRVAIALAAALASAAAADATPPQEAAPAMDLNAAFKALAAGDFDGIDEFLARDAEALPLLIAKLQSKKTRVRSTAVDLLVRIDRRHDGVVDRPDVAQALLAVITDAEEEDEVLDEAMRGLQHLDRALASQELTDALLGHLADGHARAAAVLGAIGDATMIPRLLAFQSSFDPGVARWSTLAAARLGDSAAQAIAVSRLTVEGRTRNDALIDLAYVRAPSTARAVAAYLDHPGIPASADADVRMTPYRYVAAWALGEILADGPVRRHDASLLTEQDVTAWREWWLQNAARFP